MRIIGIDPGTVLCGYGIVEIPSSQPPKASQRVAKGGLSVPDQQRTTSREPIYIASGDIKMNKRDNLPERLKVLYHSLKAVIDKYKPSHLCIEKIFYHKSIRSAFALGSTRGVTLLLAAENAMPVFEYNPTELKMALTGYGRAEKRQVREMVIRILKLNPPPLTLSEDSSDALALCICHVNSYAGKARQNSEF